MYDYKSRVHRLGKRRVDTYKYEKLAKFVGAVSGIFFIGSLALGWTYHINMVGDYKHIALKDVIYLNTHH